MRRMTATAVAFLASAFIVTGTAIYKLGVEPHDRGSPVANRGGEAVADATPTTKAGKQGADVPNPDVLHDDSARDRAPDESISIKLLRGSDEIFIYSGGSGPRGIAEVTRVIIRGRRPEAPGEVARALESASDAMFAALDERDPAGYRAAVEALKKLAPERARVELEERLESGEEEEDSEEAERWRFGGAPSRELSSQPPASSSASGSSEGRALAAEGLGILGSQKSVEALIRTFHGPDMAAREQAAASLARIGGEAAESFLVSAALELLPALLVLWAGYLPHVVLTHDC